ncbi:toxin-antitoxin system YwqK family antitoxin [Labilibaculum sp.]|uniref:toxin-antitoxin system YwqK family antitoxin n=1 Tax=Labilibaculum sp. TaxID=2060723 RepID=UPI00356AFD36
MNFARFFFVLLLFLPFSSKAQDTIYFNQNWQFSEKNNAQFYSTVQSVLNVPNEFVVRDFSMDGNLLAEYHYKALTDNVDWTRIYAEGFQDQAIENGTCIEYYPSGKKRKQFEIVAGKQKGKITVWRENGNKEREFIAENNVANGVYSEFFENGKTSLLVKFENDTLQGGAIYYHSNGKISNMGKFAKGIKTGLWTYLSEDGVPVAEELYKKAYFIDGPDIHISFPEGLWYLSQKYQVEGRLNFLFYRLASDGDDSFEETASCLISLESVRVDLSLADYSKYRRDLLTIDVKSEVAKENHLFSLPNCIAYLGEYRDSPDQYRKSILLYALQNQVGVEMVLDCKEEDFESLQDEFALILQSLKK